MGHTLRCAGAWAGRWVAGCDMGGLLAAGQPDYELCLLGGLLDGQSLFHTHVGLRLGGELAGLGLRPVADT